MEALMTGSESMQVADDLVRAGRDAMDRHAWTEAFDLLSEADRSQKLNPDELGLLGDAAWWAGRFRDAIVVRERAFAEFTSAGENQKAAAVAIKIAADHYRSLSRSLASGWYSQAERLLSGEPEGAAHGWLSRELGTRALEAGDLEKALGHATTALDIGARIGDRDVLALGLQLKGQVLMAQGQVEEGVALQDEATVAAVSGDLQPLTTGIVYCNTIWSASNMADYRRAGEWTDAATRWCERQSINGFPGVCRVHRAEIMRLRGAWGEAADGATAASRHRHAPTDRGQDQCRSVRDQSSRGGGPRRPPVPGKASSGPGSHRSGRRRDGHRSHGGRGDGGRGRDLRHPCHGGHGLNRTGITADGPGRAGGSAPQSPPGYRAVAGNRSSI